MKYKFTILIVFILFYGVFYYKNTQLKNDRIDLILNEQINILKTHYNLTMNYFYEDTKSIKASLKNDDKVIQLFLKANNAS